MNAVQAVAPERLDNAVLEALALDCRGTFLALNGAVIRGERPWMGAEDVFAEALDAALARRKLDIADDGWAGLRSAWRHMPAWPGAAEAIRALRRRYLLAPLTVLSLPMVLGSSYAAAIDWDCILSCDLLGCYKPDPRCFVRATELLAVQAADVMMVASHPSDLRGAKAAGWRTAYIRARLFDPDDNYVDCGFAEEFDLVVENFEELAQALLA